MKKVFDIILALLPYAALIILGLIVLGIVATILKYTFMLISSVLTLGWLAFKITWITHTTFFIAAFVTWVVRYKINLLHITSDMFLTPEFIMCLAFGIIGTAIKLIIQYSDLNFARYLRVRKTAWEINKYNLGSKISDELKANYASAGVYIK